MSKFDENNNDLVIVKSSFIERMAKEVFKGLQTEPLKRSYANALKKSIMMDASGKQYPEPKNVKNINNTYGFNMQTQIEYYLAINKPEC